jgi:hypothetical protein
MAAGSGYTDRRSEPVPHNFINSEGGNGTSNEIGGGNSGGNHEQQNYNNGEPRNNNNVENWTQSETDRPAGQPAATSNGTTGRPRLGSKRGRDGGGTPDAEAQQEDGPPRTRQRQLQL